MSENSIIFDPNAVGNKNCGIYGLPFTPQTASAVLIPVPWDVTTSYGGGTFQGPEAILEASYQVDLYHPDFPTGWEAGYAMLDSPQNWIKENNALRDKAAQIIAALEDGQDIAADPKLQKSLDQLNQKSEKLNQWVEETADFWLDQGRFVGLVGGDHSTPLGLLRALAKRVPHFGILHIDAHMDLRIAYEGFTYSHASIMHNAMQLKSIARLVQVGIRDYCEQEWQASLDSKGRIKVFTDQDIKRQLFMGKTFESICKKIINALPDLVYISVDIDGLEPSLCPNTGTPVAGGFSLEHVSYLLSLLAPAKKTVIGFDLVEVSPGNAESQWDANVGARMLYQLLGYSTL